MVNDLDPVTWYSDRQLEYTPKHFVVTRTEITETSKLWILNNLKGRFSIINDNTNSNDLDNGLIFFNMTPGVPAFEDPAEAVMYELKWS